VEISPSDSEIMIAEPVGNEEGLGVMGFCYVPYHFVYDLSFPVLIQVSDGFEIFQFPVVVIIDGNLPRKADLGNIEVNEDIDLCAFAEGEVVVYTYDTGLNPVEADISYKCFDNVCDLGRTGFSGSDAILRAGIPICYNGYLIADSEGYAEKKILFSSTSETIADIILDRSLEVEVDVRVAGRDIGEGFAVVHFVNVDGKSTSAVLPDNNVIELSEGGYDVKVYVYGDSGVTIPGTTKTECVDVPKNGIGGIFGATEEQCFEIDIPEVKIEQSLVGGGNTNTYILESDLEHGKIEIDVSELPRADSLEQLQYNYEVFDTLGVQVRYG